MGGTGIPAGGKLEFLLGRGWVDGAGMGLWEEAGTVLGMQGASGGEAAPPRLCSQ